MNCQKSVPAPTVDATLACSLLAGVRKLKASKEILMLFGLNPADPLSLTGAAAALILVAMLACYLPALAASRMDPIRALREG